MASTRNWIAVAATIFIGLAASVPASATIIGGGVTAGAGTFEPRKIDASPEAVLESTGYEGWPPRSHPS